MVRTTMTAIRKREINLYGGRCWLAARQGQARISRFDARFTAALVYSPTCSLFSLLFSSADSARCLASYQRRLSSHSWCNVDRVAVRESDKSGTGKYIHRGLHGDFEESVWIQRDRGEPAPRVTTTAGALWMAVVLESFREGLSFLWNLCSSPISSVRDEREVILKRRTFGFYFRITAWFQTSYGKYSVYVLILHCFNCFWSSYICIKLIQVLKDISSLNNVWKNCRLYVFSKIEIKIQTRFSFKLFFYLSISIEYFYISAVSFGMLTVFFFFHIPNRLIWSCKLWNCKLSVRIIN